MRIIAGKYRGTKLVAPKGAETRPTSDRVRESVFNILEHGDLLSGGLAGVRVLDVFAGTGAMGLEALSRGASFVNFVDADVAARAAIRQNIESTHTYGVTKILRLHAEKIGLKPRRVEPFELIFLDPPYKDAVGTQTISALIEDGWIANEACFVLETDERQEVEPPDGIEVKDERTYGGTKVTFLVRRNA